MTKNFASEKKEYNICGSLAWEESEGGARIVKLLEDSVSVVVPREIEGLPVVEVGDFCFIGKKTLQEVSLPDTLKKIGTNAFAACSDLRRLELPDSVEELGSYMLRDSGVTEVKLPANLKVLPDCVFSYCQGLRNLKLNEGLKYIGSHAFWSTIVGSEEPLVVPDSVEEIAPGAFASDIGYIQIQTTMPRNPFWFTNLPAPYVPKENKRTEIIPPAIRQTISDLLEEYVSQLSRKAARLRWEYRRGLMTPIDIRRSLDKDYWNINSSLWEELNTLRRENGFTINDSEFRYLNEVLLISCGLGYHLDKHGNVYLSLLEDVEGDDELMPHREHLIWSGC